MAIAVRPDLRDTRRDQENALYEVWARTEGAERVACEEELRGILRNHAQAVMYSVLRRCDAELLTEAVDRVMINLGDFHGDSLFTTWVHRILMNMMYDRRRLERQRREVSLDTNHLGLMRDSDVGTLDALLTVQKVLSVEDYAMFDRIVLCGETQQEVADATDSTQQAVSRSWARITRRLSRAFAK